MRADSRSFRNWITTERRLMAKMNEFYQIKSFSIVLQLKHHHSEQSWVSPTNWPGGIFIGIEKPHINIITLKTLTFECPFYQTTNTLTLHTLTIWMASRHCLHQKTGGHLLYWHFFEGVCKSTGIRFRCDQQIFIVQQLFRNKTKATSDANCENKGRKLRNSLEILKGELWNNWH